MDAYAIVKTGGKQYTVHEGDVIKVELLAGKNEGDTVELTTLAAGNGEALKVGTPELSESVTATVLEAGKAKKVVIFKRRKRSTYRRKNGHRQNYHSIRIESIPVN